MKKGAWVLMAKFVVAAGFIYALYHWNFLQLDYLVRVGLAPLSIAISLLLLFLAICGNVWRWQILLRSQNIRLSTWTVFQVVYIAMVGNVCLPGGAGGDVVRLAYLLRLVPNRKTAIAISVFVDRLSAVVGVFVTVVFALALHFDVVLKNSALAVLAAMISCAVIGAIVILVVAIRVGNALIPHFQERFRLFRFIGWALESLAAYQRTPGALLGAIAISACVQILLIITVVVLAQHLKFGALSPLDYAVSMPLTTLINAIPITPGGIGVGEAAFEYLCQAMGGGSGFAAIFLTYRILAITVSLPGVAFYLGFRSRPSAGGAG